jgi:hypothetical protein
MQSRVANRLIALSEAYQLASREMSLVAVVTRPSDRPNELPETRVVPVGMPQDTQFSSHFLDQRLMAALPTLTASPATPPVSMKKFSLADSGDFLDSGTHVKSPPSAGRWRNFLFRRGPVGERSGNAVRPAPTPEEKLLELASQMDPDGGMPGKNREARANATVLALLAFSSNGHTPTRGAFRSHVTRLVSFLQSLTGLAGDQQAIVDAVIEMAAKGTAPAGEWITLAHTSGMHWKEVERVVRA